MSGSNFFSIFFTGSPSSIATNISINGNVVEGAFTHQHVVDVIRYGITNPSFTVSIRN